MSGDRIHRIDPEDVAFLRQLRRFVAGGSARDVPMGEGSAARPVSPRKSSLGRVVDVRWTLPIVNQFGAPIVDLLPGTRFGRVEWMPDEPGQLQEEDWLVLAQPLDVLQYDRALPRALGPNFEGQPPFIPAKVGPSFNPLAWWPYDDVPGDTVCDVLGSPFWLVVEGGPENGTLARIPIPIVGAAIAVRGRNVSASIEYDPAFAALGNVFVPLETDVLRQGAGKILVTITKSQPTTRIVCDQMRRFTFRPTQAAPIVSTSCVWIPKFCSRVVSGGTNGELFQFVDQTGRVLAGFFDPGSNGYAPPHGAVALRRILGDVDAVNLPVAFEVFA